MRVSKNHAYIKVNAHESESERIAFSNWNLVAKTSLYTHEWMNIFNEITMLWRDPGTTYLVTEQT